MYCDNRRIIKQHFTKLVIRFWKPICPEMFRRLENRNAMADFFRNKVISFFINTPPTVVLTYATYCGRGEGRRHCQASLRGSWLHRSVFRVTATHLNKQYIVNHTNYDISMLRYTGCLDPSTLRTSIEDPIKQHISLGLGV